MKLRVGRLLRAAGALLGLFVVIPLVAWYAVTRGLLGQFYIAAAVVSFLGAAALLMRPGLGAWLWGASAAGNLLLGLAFGCLGLVELHAVPQPLAPVIGWAGVALFAAGLVVQGRRGAASGASHRPAA